MIVFDMEWNSGCDDISLDEILQIGAVRLDRLGGRILGCFDARIRPRVHPELGVTARKVLDLCCLESTHDSFAGAYADFRRWCGEEREFATWGNCDMEVLRRSCIYWELPQPDFGEIYDIQDSFSALLGSKQRIALYRAVEYCGIPDCFECHNALHDALYTALVGERLPPDGVLRYAPPKRIGRLSKLSFSRQPRRKIGLYRSEEAALNARNSREMSCPVCGAKSWVNVWYFEQPHQYYTDFHCQEHGWFIGRLSLSRNEDGMWCGRTAVPAVTAESKRNFYTAVKHDFFLCRKRETAHKRRRKRRRRKSGQGVGGC